MPVLDRPTLTHTPESGVEKATEGTFAECISNLTNLGKQDIQRNLSENPDVKAAMNRANPEITILNAKMQKLGINIFIAPLEINVRNSTALPLLINLLSKIENISRMVAEVERCAERLNTIKKSGANDPSVQNRISAIQSRIDDFLNEIPPLLSTIDLLHQSLAAITAFGITPEQFARIGAAAEEGGHGYYTILDEKTALYIGHGNIDPVTGVHCATGINGEDVVSHTYLREIIAKQSISPGTTLYFASCHSGDDPKLAGHFEAIEKETGVEIKLVQGNQTGTVSSRRSTLSHLNTAGAENSIVAFKRKTGLESEPAHTVSFNPKKE